MQCYPSRHGPCPHQACSLEEETFVDQTLAQVKSSLETVKCCEVRVGAERKEPIWSEGKGSVFKEKGTACAKVLRQRGVGSFLLSFS